MLSNSMKLETALSHSVVSVKMQWRCCDLGTSEHDTHMGSPTSFPFHHQRLPLNFYFRNSYQQTS